MYSIFSRSHKEAARVIDYSLDGVLLEKQVNPVYLGANLDRQLNMIPFMDSLKKKAMAMRLPSAGSRFDMGMVATY